MAAEVATTGVSAAVRAVPVAVAGAATAGMSVARFDGTGIAAAGSADPVPLDCAVGGAIVADSAGVVADA